MWVFCVKGLSELGLKNTGIYFLLLLFFLPFLPLCWFEPGVLLCCWAFIYALHPLKLRHECLTFMPDCGDRTHKPGLELWHSDFLIVSKTNGLIATVTWNKHICALYLYLRTGLAKVVRSCSLLSFGGILLHGREKPVLREQWVPSWNLIW